MKNNNYKKVNNGKYTYATKKALNKKFRREWKKRR